MNPDLPSYTHVFRDGQPKKHWLKLEADETLSILLANFWGEDIREEKRRWLETPTASGAYQMDDEAPVIAANFAFSLDIGLNVSRIWVRKDYVLLYDECTDYFTDPDNEKFDSRPPSIVITGQPGIGKSYWIYYAIRRRLGEKKPLIWYFLQKWYLFVEDGVFRCPEDFSPDIFRQGGLWVLVNTDGSMAGVPAILAESESKVNTIFTSSPWRERWKGLLKTTMCSQLIMNPWSWDEIYQAAVARGFTPDKINKVQSAFDHLGPTAWFCLDFVRNPRQVVAYESHRDAELGKLSMGDLKKAITDSSTLEFRGSHSIFIIRRRTPELPPSHEHYLQEYTIEPITPYILQKLKYKLMDAQQEQQLDLYQTLESALQTRQLASLVYEMIGHRIFRSKIDLTLVPMVMNRNPKRKLTWWHSQFLGDLGPMDSKGVFSITFSPPDIARYNWPGPSVIKPLVYYIPEASNQTAFDSFVMDNEILFLFQFTIASSHGIKPGMMDFLSQQLLQTTLQGKELCFVFIIPPGHKVECPKASDDKLEEFWRKVMLYSATLDPKEKG